MQRVSSIKIFSLYFFFFSVCFFLHCSNQMDLLIPLSTISLQTCEQVCHHYLYLIFFFYVPIVHRLEGSMNILWQASSSPSSLSQVHQTGSRTPGLSSWRSWLALEQLSPLACSSISWLCTLCVAGPPSSASCSPSVLWCSTSRCWPSSLMPTARSVACGGSPWALSTRLCTHRFWWSWSTAGVCVARTRPTQPSTASSADPWVFSWSRFSWFWCR